MLTELLVGFVLLMSPYDENNTIKVDLQTRMAAAEWAIKFELFDAKEREYLKETEAIVVFNGLDYEALSPTEIIPVLQRINGNLKDAPKIEDLVLFPNRSFIQEQVTSNENFNFWLFRLKEISPPWNDDVIQITTEETRYLNTLYYAIYRATDEDSSVAERRHNLKLFRDMVGIENYYNGYMPPAFPHWRLPR